MIRAVTFDFWETLVRDSAENLAAQRALRIRGLHAGLARAGIVRSPAVVEEAHDRSQTVLVDRYWGRHRDLSSEEQVRLVLDCVEVGLGDRLPASVLAETVAAYISPVLAHPPMPSPGVAESVPVLASRGITLGIISNTGRTPGVILRRVLEAHDLLRHFTAISYSDEVRWRKPDPRIFEVTLARAGVAPGEAAHVGDNPVDDVTGARGAGMRSIHYVAAGRRPPAPDADLVVSDLGALPEALARLG